MNKILILGSNGMLGTMVAEYFLNLKEYEIFLTNRVAESKDINNKTYKFDVLVDDLEVAEAWYTQKLAGVVTFRDDKYIRIKISNTSIALIDKKHYPHQHFGILVENSKDLPFPYE